MNTNISGLHHVTALASDPQRNVDFYAGILGLRMVKKTINFDAPDVYHLYYGDEMGEPGTIMTFFPFPGIRGGRNGVGQVNTTSFSISLQSLDYWQERLKRFSIPFSNPQERFNGEISMYFQDFDGLGLELVVSDHDPRTGYLAPHIAPGHAIKGFYSVSMLEEGYEKTGAFMSRFLGYELIAEKGNRFRYSIKGKKAGFVDVVCSSDKARALGGNGTVHHLAFATYNDQQQLEIREKLLSGNVQVSQVMDRQYFHSIYFREPGGVLFEVATSDIGFHYDENVSELGESLKLPPWVEPNRTNIEKGLKPISVNTDSYKD
ncbi:MAG: VOC family protein [Cyclobacteriaceae bacterium]|nr:VOC family protein [Cyclobacteriaceae bacterium]